MHQKQTYVKRGDLYYADFNNSVGSEISGVHPVVILQNNKGNYHSPTVIVAVISSQIKKEYLPTHVLLKTGPCSKSMVQTEQLYTIDKSRLLKHIGTLDEASLKTVEKAVLKSLGLMGKEPILLSLCPKCLRDFRSVPGHSAWLADPLQVIAGTCCYCGAPKSFDYWVSE